MRARSALLAFALCALAGVPPALAARLPKWARPIAERAGDVPTDAATNQPIVLLRERTVEVDDDGRLRTRLHAAVQLTSASNALAADYFPFHEGTKVKTARAYHLPPGKTVQKSDSDDAFDVTLGDAFIGGKRVRSIHMDGGVRGSLVFFEFESVEPAGLLEITDTVTAVAPIRRWQLRLELPRGWAAAYAWLRTKGPEPAREGDALVWELKDVPPYTPPPRLADDARHVAPRLSVAITPATPLDALHVATWPAAATWYDAVTKRGAADPAIANEAARVCDGVSEGLPCALALTRYVRDRVRYVAVDLGVTGYAPRAPAETLTTLWGDCKDKAALLRALLAARGLQGHPVLVNATEAGTVDERLASLMAFDHVVVAIEIPPGSAVPPWIEPARVDGGTLGALLIVDPTSEHSAVGAIPTAIRGRRALVSAAEGGHLLTIPPSRPDEHRVEVAFDVRRAPDGSTDWMAEIVATGAPAAVLRQVYDQSAEDYRKEVETRLREQWIDAKLASSQVTREREDGAFVERRHWSVAAPADTGATIPLFPGTSDLLPRVPLSKRTVDVVYGFPRVFRATTRMSGVSATGTLPSPKNADLPCGSVRSSVAREGDVITGFFETSLRTERIEPAGFADLKSFWSVAVSAAELTLKP